MSSTRFDVAVFDFDGTLVQSADSKRQAFFDIFPVDFAHIVQGVLAAEPDESRYNVIPMILAEAQRRGFFLPNADAKQLVETYSRAVALAVKAAPAVPGAENALRSFAQQLATYVFSVTPHDELNASLASRGWIVHTSGVFGYPFDKTETVAALLERHSIPASRLLVIGDGVSDLRAAKQNGCAFFQITRAYELAAAAIYAGVSHA